MNGWGTSRALGPPPPNFWWAVLEVEHEDDAACVLKMHHISAFDAAQQCKMPREYSQ